MVLARARVCSPVVIEAKPLTPRHSKTELSASDVTTETSNQMTFPPILLLHLNRQIVITNATAVAYSEVIQQTEKLQLTALCYAGKCGTATSPVLHCSALYPNRCLRGCLGAV